MATNTTDYKFKKISKIGNGTYSRVYSARSPNGGKYAVKMNLNHGYDFFSGQRELDINKKLKHEYIMSIEKIARGSPFNYNVLSPLDDELNATNDSLNYIYPLATCDLANYINENSMTSLEIKSGLKQLLLALEYIHDSGYVHRDIKPGNILIEKKNNNTLFKIGDFGLAKPFLTFDYQTPNVMSSWYRAPEVSLGSTTYSKKADIWSLGVVLNNMVSNKNIGNTEPDADDEILVQSIINTMPYKITSQLVDSLRGKYCKLQFKYPQKLQTEDEFIEPDEYGWDPLPFTNEGGYEEYKLILFGMLCFDPANRMSATEILNHKFFDHEENFISLKRTEYKPYKEIAIKEKINLGHIREIAMIESNEVYKARNRLTWYTHKILFQSIMIFDRALNSNIFDKKNYNGTSEDRYVQLCYYNCLYLAVKYFSVLRDVVGFSDVVYNHNLKTKKNLLKGTEIFEHTLMHSILDYKIYRKTCFDFLVNTKVPLEIETNSMLLMVWSGHHNGKTPCQSFNYWCKHKNFYINKIKQYA